MKRKKLGRDGVGKSKKKRQQEDGIEETCAGNKCALAEERGTKGKHMGRRQMLT